MDQIVEAFGLGETELAVLECAPGKLARLRCAHILEGRECSEQRREHRAPAMDVKLRNILASRACGCWKPKDNRIVDRLLICVA